MTPLSLKLAGDAIDDPRSYVRERLSSFGLATRLGPGASVAVTAGSRGFGGQAQILSGIVDAIRAAGGRPMIVPAMGSHGGATAEGQLEILRRLGVVEGAIEAPIASSMNALKLGVSATGAAAYIDEIADQADGIIVLGRTQAHPENSAGIASGLLKMTAVGLGKQLGALEAHSHGLWPSIEAMAEVILGSAKVICGVSVIENAFRKPSVIEVVPPTFEAFRDADRRLLLASTKYSAKIPFRELDLLIVDELGKNISGTGMDLNVIGRWRVVGGPREPDYRRIAVLSLTHESMGNGLGIGLADFTTVRFARSFDPTATYVNLLTASEPGVRNTVEGPLPLALESDREAVEIALASGLASGEPRVCRIWNTARLDRISVSPSLLAEVRERSELSVEGEPVLPTFDLSDNLF